LSVTGLPALQQILQGMQRALGTESLRACTAAAAQPILFEAQQRAPVRTGAVRAALQVVTPNSPRRNSSSSVVQVANSGPGGATHEAIFSEYGTEKQAARPFLRPAFETQKQAAVEAFAAQLARNLQSNK
jgi:HK97 gp10 family phage protein